MPFLLILFMFSVDSSAQTSVVSDVVPNSPYFLCLFAWDLFFHPGGSELHSIYFSSPSPPPPPLSSSSYKSLSEGSWDWALGGFNFRCLNSEVHLTVLYQDSLHLVGASPVPEGGQTFTKCGTTEPLISPESALVVHAPISVFHFHVVWGKDWGARGFHPVLTMRWGGWGGRKAIFTAALM